MRRLSYMRGGVDGVEATRYRADAVAAAWHRGNAGEPDVVSRRRRGDDPTPPQRPKREHKRLAIGLFIRRELLHSIEPSFESWKIRQPPHGPRVAQRFGEHEVRGRRAFYPTC